jgi:hypothetical protein
MKRLLGSDLRNPSQVDYDWLMSYFASTSDALIIGRAYDADGEVKATDSRAIKMVVHALH